MSIIGKPLSAPPAVPDWDEQDSSAGGFIRNKPDFLLRTGGSLTGDLSMSGNAVTDVKAPEKETDAANKAYVDAKHITATASLPASGWSSSVPYAQTITVEGLMATDAPHVSPVYSDTLTTAIAQQEAWSAVSKAVAEDGSITFTCFEDKPTTDIPIQLEVNR